MLYYLKKYKNHFFSVGIIALIIATIATGLSFYQFSHTGEIYPNIYIGNLDFSSLSKKQAMSLLNKKVESLLEKGLTISIQNRVIDISLREYAADPDLSRDLIKYNIEKTVEKAYSIGRKKNPFTNLKDILTVILYKKQIEPELNIDKNALLTYIKEKIKKYQAPGKDAKIAFINNHLVIKKGKPGFTIEAQKLLTNIEEPLKKLQTPTPTAKLIPDLPKIKKEELEAKIKDINKIITKAPITLEYDKYKWDLLQYDIQKSLSAKKINNKVILYLKEEGLSKLLNNINEKINIPARDAKFNLKDGRVVEFQSSQTGIEVDKIATLKALNYSLLTDSKIVKIAVKISKPKISMEDANKLGIHELLGVGTSDFSGSPKNRIHNIKVGASKLNGLLIKPGEEFSLLKALGEINGETGFKQELVIKGDRTVPEYGGGLCQIGTTTFRATLASGLPITERYNHSYRVSYYEPAGTDATIYDPAPDYKFINDTPGHILILTKIIEDGRSLKLVFEFWGTKDGREFSSTKPEIYNITDPPEPKFIITSELAPGEKKKLESAHKGASASFNYTIKYNNPNKEDIEKTFYSYYRPWAEIWMIGATTTKESEL